MDAVRVCWLEEGLVSETEARVSALDRGFLYGDGLFETLRTYGGRPFLLAEHWARLRTSAEFLGIEVPAVEPETLVTRLVEANRLPNAAVRITLTRGPLPKGPRPGTPATPTLFAQARPLPSDLDQRTAQGIDACRLPWPLRARGLPLQGHKTLAYLPSVVALGAVPEGAEPLLETTEGHVSEGATSNVFWVRVGRLFTPHTDAGCLPGVARRLVLSLAEELGVSAEPGLYPTADLAAADEAFVTSSVVEALPLVRLDGEPIGAGAPGPVTRRLHAAYREAVRRATGSP
ncbi:MAG: aminotransferase class IV [Deltaproteobacteria bacterium]|nr:aminotransferase class IV [Deltaproteobacteria bacterium]